MYSFIWCKHLLLRETDVLKILIFSERKFEEMHFEEQKDTRYIRGNVVLTLLSSAFFRLQNLSQISFNLFCSGDKRFLSEFLRK